MHVIARKKNVLIEKKEWYEKSSSKSSVETSKKGHERTWENFDIKKLKQSSWAKTNVQLNRKAIFLHLLQYSLRCWYSHSHSVWSNGFWVCNKCKSTFSISSRAFTITWLKDTSWNLGLFATFYFTFQNRIFYKRLFIV